MAAQEVLLEDPHEETINNSKKWILKVSIHCEGCKRKVKKILSQVEGVQETDIDARQQKVTVTGNVDADTLLRKLTKSGKHAELWPENPDRKEKKSAKPTKKEKVLPSTQQETLISQTVVNVKEVKPQPPPVKAEVAAQEQPPKDSQGGGGNNSGGGGAAKVGGAGKSTTTIVEESGANGNSKAGGAGDSDVAKELNKSEGKKPESGSGGPRPTMKAAEEKGGESDRNTSVVAGKVGGGGNDDGNSGKKKKNKGQSGKNNISEPESSVAAGNGGPRYHEDDTPNVTFPDHHSGPRHPMYDHYPPPPQFYGPPGPTPPAAAAMYAQVSYNTAYPTSSYTASHYAPAPPNSYVYSYPGGPEIQANPPYDVDPYSSRQPLDSFEMFSDENPNGCLIM